MTRRNKLIERLANDAEQDARLIAHQAQQIRKLEKQLAEKTRQRDEWHRAWRETRRGKGARQVMRGVILMLVAIAAGLATMWVADLAARSAL